MGGWLEVILGVTQESILETILLNIFTNDLLLFINEKDVCNFANDKILYKCERDLEINKCNISHKLEVDANIETKYLQTPKSL